MQPVAKHNPDNVLDDDALCRTVLMSLPEDFYTLTFCGQNCTGTVFLHGLQLSSVSIIPPISILIFHSSSTSAT